MIIDLVNKVIVVTGSSRGIGCMLAKKLATENAKIVINYNKSYDDAKELYNEILQYNPNCIMVQADITQQNDVVKLYQSTINEFGRVDVLINNAGVCYDNRIQLMQLKTWDKVIDVNLKGTFLCSKYFSKKMIKQKNGKIINIASLKGQDGSSGQVNYSASKAGIIGLTKALAKELAVFNISVNAVCPGFIVTDLNKNNNKKYLNAKEQSMLSIEYSLEDLLDFITYLSSDKLMGVTGRVFNLDSRIL